MKKEIYTMYKHYCNLYKLSEYKSKNLWKIIRPICYHKEFLKRFKSPYWHHDNKTIAEHIICDTIVTYKIVDKLQKKKRLNKIINIKNAILISMFHDLYQEPWQNNFDMNYKKLINKHAFTHPIEAAINAITWFPQYFENKNDAFIIIDGIVHHMFPLPVRAVNNNDMQLNNNDKYNNISNKYIKMLQLSTKTGRFNNLSLRKSLFLEGRIMSKADKIVAIRKDLKSIDGYIAFLTGKNKKLINKKVD